MMRHIVPDAAILNTVTAEELPDVSSRGWYIVNSFVTFVERTTKKEKVLSQEERQTYQHWSSMPFAFETETVLVPEVHFLVARDKDSALAEAMATIDQLRVENDRRRQTSEDLGADRRRLDDENASLQTRLKARNDEVEMERKKRMTAEESMHKNEKNSSLMKKKLDAMIAAVGSIRAKEILAQFEEPAAK